MIRLKDPTPSPTPPGGSPLLDQQPCQHDWMAMGSREVCIKCDKARMRKDLPAWEFDKRGAVVTSSKPKTKRRGR